MTENWRVKTTMSLSVALPPPKLKMMLMPKPHKKQIQHYLLVLRNLLKLHKMLMLLFEMKQRRMHLLPVMLKLHTMLMLQFVLKLHLKQKAQRKHFRLQPPSLLLLHKKQKLHKMLKLYCLHKLHLKHS